MYVLSFPCCSYLYSLLHPYPKQKIWLLMCDRRAVTDIADVSEELFLVGKERHGWCTQTATVICTKASHLTTPPPCPFLPPPASREPSLMCPQKRVEPNERRHRASINFENTPLGHTCMGLACSRARMDLVWSFRPSRAASSATMSTGSRPPGGDRTFPARASDGLKKGRLSGSIDNHAEKAGTPSPQHANGVKRLSRTISQGKTSTPRKREQNSDINPSKSVVSRRNWAFNSYDSFAL